MTETLGSDGISTKRRRIAKLARKSPEMALTTLAHHIDLNWLREAYERTRKDGAVGVDGQRATEYAANLESNLRDLLERFKSGTYKAPPVRRAWVPKEGAKPRPIGVPTFEDKVLQRAVLMVLESVYEEDFLDCSYGYRPGRSAHDALQEVWKGVMNVEGGWVLDADIQGFFDTLSHPVLRDFLDQRVRDGVLRRTVHKWLNAGVLEEGMVNYPEFGTSQGGVISPLLANLYLHEVLDKWFEFTIKPRLRGHAVLVRYADDFIIAFERRDDAERVLAVLPKRFGKFGLTLHPEKTRLLRFRKPRRDDVNDDGHGAKPETFGFLGFTHYWGYSRKGKRVVKRKTEAKRFRRALLRIKEWCRDHRHERVREQHTALSRKVQGHYGYYGLTGNARWLYSFLTEVERIWRKYLDRRGQRRSMPWERFQLLKREYPLPKPRVVHSYYRRAANP
jgi:RNA-directed DNA polymerase